MDVYKYYIKTEQELIDEFGEDWVYGTSMKTDWSSPEMDYLFGMELKLEWYKDNLVNGRLKFDDMKEIYVPCDTSLICRGTWMIWSDVIKEVNYKPDYNSKRQLVYEGLKYKDYEVVGVKCKDQDEFIESQKYLFSKGYKWGYNEGLIIDVRSRFIIFKDYTNDLTYISDDRDDNFLDNYLDNNYRNDNHITVNGLTELKKLFQIDYNNSRQLVYENKILKFNEIY